MTKPMLTTKPDHHRVPVKDVREWHANMGINVGVSICMYCDENVDTPCSQSCGTYSVWVDTPTLAQITLELNT